MQPAIEGNYNKLKRSTESVITIFKKRAFRRLNQLNVWRIISIQYYKKKVYLLL